MSGKRGSNTVSLRVRLSQDTIERIDRLVGEGGRQRFIREAVEARLQEDLPPVVNELILEVEELKNRVSYLERIRDTSVYRGDLKDVIRIEVCRDDLERKILEAVIMNRGATTTELAEDLLGSAQKRRTILNRIEGLNERATDLLGHPILEHERGERDGKRSAWWAIDPESLMA